MKKTDVFCLKAKIGICLMAGCASVGIVRAAIPTAGGTYAWSDYFTAGGNADFEAKAMSGDQTWTIAAGGVEVGNFFPGCQNSENPYVQTFVGGSVTVKSSGKLRFYGGKVVFENQIKSLNTEKCTVGCNAPGNFLLRNGGTLTVSGSNLEVGGTGTGVIYLEDPSALTCSNQSMWIGNSSSGAIWMDGGQICVSGSGKILAVGDANSADGYLRQNGGKVSISEADDKAAIIGRYASYASYHLSGGTFGSPRTTLAPNAYVAAGAGKNTCADIYVDGGWLDMWNERFNLGAWDSGITGGRVSLTVCGTGRVTAFWQGLCNKGTGGFQAIGTGNAAVINFNGGRYELTRGILSGTTGNSRTFNFDGGTLALVRGSRTSQYAGYVDEAIPLVFYPKGGTIEVQKGENATIKNAEFRSATGWGVGAIVLTNAGSGYLTAPQVTISGGNGSGATGYAIVNRDGTLERIAVTCRGEGYHSDDVLTVTITSRTGSGASAVASLSENVRPTMRKTGAGNWLQDGTNIPFDGDIEITDGELMLKGSSVTSAHSLCLSNDSGLDVVKGSAGGVNRVEARDGIATVNAESPSGESGTGVLTIGEMTTSCGLLGVWKTNDLSVVLSTVQDDASSVVNGLVYMDRDETGYRKPSLFERTDNGALRLVETTDAGGAAANYSPSSGCSEEGAPEFDEVNSVILPLSPSVRTYVKNAGLVTVASGMIVIRRPHSDTQGFEVSGGGALTTRAKGGMFIYQDLYQLLGRSASKSFDSTIDLSKNRRMFGPFADPDANTPMSLTVAGMKTTRPEKGAVVWLYSGENTYSGGLNLVNGGVVVRGESAFGANDSPIRAAGYCSIATYNAALEINRHPIALADGSALILSTWKANAENKVGSLISGSGDLLTADIGNGSPVMEFTGDHSGFTGTYYIQGCSRATPETYSPLASICLADATNGTGVIEASGRFVRKPGTGKGEICWKTHPCYATLGYGLRGGFSAKGGALTVDLGGDGRVLVPGSDYLPENAVIQLQSAYSDGELTMANGFDLDGKLQKVAVCTGKAATLAGGLSDAVGGGCLDVEGDLSCSGTIKLTAANLRAPLLTSTGALTFRDAALDVSGLTETELEGLADGVVVATAAGGVSGTVRTIGGPSGWVARLVRGKLRYDVPKGMGIIIR